jgi:hypothetical protein
MLRRFIATEGEHGFNWRAGEITRLEAFSDAVFAFAVTLLVVSLEVPHTFHELVNVMKGFPAFAICFAMLAQVWYQHSKFFRRYGLQDTYTVFLNSVLLFVVLFYVYPLKFLFTFLLGQMSHGALMPGEAAHVPLILASGDTRALMVIYGLGFAAVFGVFAFLYLYAFRQRTALGLNELEIHRTRHSLVDNCGMVAIGLLSAGTALLLPDRAVGAAGFVYFGIGLYEWISGAIFGKRESELKKLVPVPAKASS